MNGKRAKKIRKDSEEAAKYHAENIPNLTYPRVYKAFKRLYTRGY